MDRAGDIDIPELADRVLQPAAPAHYAMSANVIQPRLKPYSVAPAMMKAVAALDSVVQSGGLEPSLVELVKTRASQINGCAYCLHMHTRDARAGGEAEARLYLLDAWRESSLYTDRERAALAWTEAVTLVAQTRVPDDVYEDVCKHFEDEERVKLTLLVAMINVWNRIAISFRSVHPVEAKAAGPK
jgi:AhpD family alkylhydroperoxidase